MPAIAYVNVLTIIVPQIILLGVNFFFNKIRLNSASISIVPINEETNKTIVLSILMLPLYWSTGIQFKRCPPVLSISNKKKPTIVVIKLAINTVVIIFLFCQYLVKYFERNKLSVAKTNTKKIQPNKLGKKCPAMMSNLIMYLICFMFN